MSPGGSAKSRLRLTPVLFELGARPYPPRDLYRAYLEQSDVFIGIYAESYGWVGPGMEVSGLEDEYDPISRWKGHAKGRLDRAHGCGRPPRCAMKPGASGRPSTPVS